MQTCEKFIAENNLFKSGEIIGVGCSGGSDSMALLHFLAKNQEKYDIEVVAIHVDHGIRENSYLDADFVKEKAKQLGVRFYKFRVDAPKIAKEKSISIETAARDARYGVFRALLKKGVVDKIALAHHMLDQAETILMHIFRGSGVAGARGMSAISENVFVRPLLSTQKQEIYDYLDRNHIEFVEDETNEDMGYSRNFVRNRIMKDILSRWSGAACAIVNFGKAVQDDDDYINSQIHTDAFIVEDRSVKIPLSYFLYPNAISSRIVFRAFNAIGINTDVEKKHIDMIKELARAGENGKRLNLPFDIIAVKEYDYLTIYNRHEEKPVLDLPFKCGEFDLPNGKKLIVKRVKDFNLTDGQLILDYRKVPKEAFWRFRKDGDVFTKFGGGTKKLKSFLIDKKVPSRLRDQLPLLVVGNEVLAIAGIEISEKVKVENVPTAYMIEIKG